MKTVRMILDSVPISINQAYKTLILKRHGKLLPVRAATTDLILYKSGVKNFIAYKKVDTSAVKHLKGEKLSLHILISSSDWMTLKNTIKQNDITNRIKTLEDAVFEALGINDSQVWNCNVYKDEIEKKDRKKIRETTKVVVETYEEHLKRNPQILDIFKY